jgi:ADP-heptose:LPS heptosyltransferase
VSWKSLEKRAKRSVTVALGHVLGASGTPSEIPWLSDVDRLLLIRQQNQFGDMLLGTPVFRAVRAAAPKARIDLVTSPANHLAALGNRHLDEVLLYDKAHFLRRPLEGKRFADRLRDARYDLAIVLSTVSFSMTSAWLAAVSGARRRAGRTDAEGRGEDVAMRLYDWLLPPPVANRHQTGVNLDVVSPFGVSCDDWRPEIHLTRAESSAGAAALTEALGARDASGGATRSLRIVMHPGAGKLPNRWPATRFGEVARTLMDAGHRVAAAAGPAEQSLLSDVDRGAGSRISRLSPMPVREFGGVLESADLLLANDTGVLHLGAATGASVLALFGPTDPALWCPATPRVRWMRAPGDDLAELTTNVVGDAMSEFVRHLREGTPAPANLAPEFAP